MGKGEGTFQVFYEKLSCLLFFICGYFVSGLSLAWLMPRKVNIANASLYLQPVLIFIL